MNYKLSYVYKHFGLFFKISVLRFLVLFVWLKY